MLLGVALCYWFAAAQIPTWLWVVTWCHFGLSLFGELGKRELI